MKAATLSRDNIISAISEVTDPEIPVISVTDLGIITSVAIEGGNVRILMAPTFTACPATEMMRKMIMERTEKVEGVSSVEVLIDFSVPWNSNRISETGRKKLKEFGLAPPPVHDGTITGNMVANTSCPYCDSDNTSINTLFGPTLCRSMHYCHNCRQSFQQFKPI